MTVVGGFTYSRLFSSSESDDTASFSSSSSSSSSDDDDDNETLKPEAKPKEQGPRMASKTAVVRFSPKKRSPISYGEMMAALTSVQNMNSRRATAILGWNRSRVNKYRMMLTQARAVGVDLSQPPFASSVVVGPIGFQNMLDAHLKITTILKPPPENPKECAISQSAEQEDKGNENNDKPPTSKVTTIKQMKPFATSATNRFSWTWTALPPSLPPIAIPTIPVPPPAHSDSPTVVLSPAVVLDSPAVVLDSPAVVLDSPTLLVSPAVLVSTEPPSVLIPGPKEDKIRKRQRRWADEVVRRQGGPLYHWPNRIIA